MSSEPLGHDLPPVIVQDYTVTPDFTLLHCVETPPAEAGGNTYWANLFRAYDELDDETRRLVENFYWVPPKHPGDGLRCRHAGGGETWSNADSRSIPRYSTP
jgi:hypothetical protein